MDERLKAIRKDYLHLLKDDELPFWLEHGLDEVNGGIRTCLDKDGSVLDSDKSVWFQGRALWIFSRAYNRVEKKAEYLHAADVIVKFIDDHCFDSDGRMFFRVTEDGRPVVKRLRYFFSECFAIIGYAEYSIASGKSEYAEKAYELYQSIEKWIEDGVYIPKVDPETRSTHSFASDMIRINVLSILRDALPGKKDWCTGEISNRIENIRRFNWRPELGAVLEEVSEDGRPMLEHFEGRIMNPGHAIEGSWFLMDEALFTGNQEYMTMALDILGCMWDKGWDREYGGGIIQYRDVLGKSLSEYHQDMKFWWPQCEALIANLEAYKITKDETYLERFLEVDDYVRRIFMDPEHGEWFGYFHRDNTRATDVKGNIYKGPFHIPRMYMKCIELIDSLK